MHNLPYLSVIIPFRNEEKFISQCLDSLLLNDYPKDKLEILLIDGLSTDKSIEIISTYIQKYPFIKIITNPKKIFPAAVNLGYTNSKGEVIAILGAHAIYNSDYFSKNVSNLYEYNADNSGGILETETVNKSIIGKTIAAALSSRFGVGNATFRTGSDKITEVDTVFGGCYKRSVFKKIGLFNENLISSSDMDFNVRLKNTGGKIILDPSVRAKYYTRSTFSKFIKNNFRNGFWAIYPIKFTKYIPVKLRHFIPLGFVMSLLCSAILSLLFPFFLIPLIAILVLYLSAATYFAFKNSDKGYNPLLLLFFFFLLHFVYGIGSLFASVIVLFTRPFTNKN